MGSGSSKDSSSDEEGDRSTQLSAMAQKLHIRGRPADSRRRRLRSRLFRRSCTKNDSSSSAGRGQSISKLLSVEDFAGIALLTLISAEMKFKDKWLACVSLGEQTFRTETSDQTDRPVWNSEKKLLLEKNGPHILRISVFETNRLSKSNLIGYCEIDLLKFLIQDIDSDATVFELLDPSSSGIIAGKISLSCDIEDPVETEKNFARRILSIVETKVSKTHLPGVHGEESHCISRPNNCKRLPEEGDKNIDQRDEVEQVIQRLFLLLRAISSSQRRNRCIKNHNQVNNFTTFMNHSPESTNSKFVVMEIDLLNIQIDHMPINLQRSGSFEGNIRLKDRAPPISIDTYA
ncbi:Phosphatidylserine decarboxylase proenzyme 2 [Linum grandiflorum]